VVPQAALWSSEAHQLLSMRPGKGAEGAQFLSARGAKPEAPHGPLQRLLGVGYIGGSGAISEGDNLICSTQQKPPNEK
jgi:hypothetical protein